VAFSVDSVDAKDRMVALLVLVIPQKAYGDAHKLGEGPVHHCKKVVVLVLRPNDGHYWGRMLYPIYPFRSGSGATPSTMPVICGLRHATTKAVGPLS
jgi:hypothetical protein